MENLANLTINRNQCIGCGKCIRTCPSGIFYLDEQKKAAHIEIKNLDGTDAGNASTVWQSALRVPYLCWESGRKTAFFLQTKTKADR